MSTQHPFGWRTTGTMRLVERQIRIVLASRSEDVDRIVAGQRPERIAESHAGNASNEED
jgi:hypothetical protein